MTEIPMQDYTVTCPNSSCINGGVELTITAPADSPTVLCGPCATQLEPSPVEAKEGAGS